MQKSTQKGFTLIELLVVIVIIGILATISVATFSGYFAKARDSERQAAVRNISTLLKTARAVDSIITYSLDQSTNTVAGAEFRTDVNDPTAVVTFAELLNQEGGYAVPAATSAGYTYAYAGSTTDFAVYICSEENISSATATDRIFVDGTSDAIPAVNAEANTICPTSGPTSTTMNTSLDVDGDGTDETILPMSA